MQVRPFRKEDATQLARLQSTTIRTINAKDHTPDEIEAWDRLLTPEAYLKKLDEKHRYVMQDHETIVGFGEVSSDGTELKTLYVDAERQGEGIGSALINKLFEKARALGAESIKTNSSVTARTFYERHGFAIIEKSSYAFPSGVSVECYRMSKEL